MDEVQRAIKKLEENNSITFIKNGRTVKERYDRLIALLPETLCWDPVSARQLVFYVQRAYKLDLGVCDYYTIEGDRQFCSIDGRKIECLCAIPEPYCVFRDKNGEPKYPEFFSIQILELDEAVRDALWILGNCAKGAAE